MTNRSSKIAYMYWGKWTDWKKFYASEIQSSEDFERALDAWLNQLYKNLRDTKEIREAIKSWDSWDKHVQRLEADAQAIQEARAAQAAWEVREAQTAWETEKAAREALETLMQRRAVETLKAQKAQNIQAVLEDREEREALKAQIAWEAHNPSPTEEFITNAVDSAVTGFGDGFSAGYEAEAEEEYDFEGFDDDDEDDIVGNPVGVALSILSFGLAKPLMFGYRLARNLLRTP